MTSETSGRKLWYCFLACLTTLLTMSMLAGFNQSLSAMPYGTTQEEDGSLAKMTASIDEAETAFKAGNFEASAERINDAIAELEKILLATRREEVAEIRKQHRRVVTAQRLLRSQRQKTDSVPRLKFNYREEPSDKDAAEMTGEKVSFTKTVAPILADKCGRCHISRRSGDVSLASVSQMTGLIETGDSAGSQLYSVIEDGSMPKGNNKLSDEEKKAVREWIEQGAKIDAAVADFDLRPLLQMTPRNDQPAAAISRASENDTVFFSKDIAPLLAETCNGCHIDANQLRGGLSLDNFARMNRGGDSGALWVAGKPDESLLVQKLKGMGDGQRMPINRPKWSDQQIELISTWIREGAHYDAPDPNTPVKQLASLSTIASMDAESLKAHRQSIAKQQWDLALVGVRSETRDTDNLHFVIGYGVETSLQKQIMTQAQKLYADFAKDLTDAKASAFARAPITVFVPKGGYDYSEFGKMVEKRDTPLQEKYHWGQTVDGPYIVINGSIKPEQLEDALTQTLPPAMVANWQPNLPQWFCNSVGSSVVDWTADQLKSVQQFFAQNAPTAAQIQQWTTDRLSNHQPYDIVAGMGWRKSRVELKKIRGSYRFKNYSNH